MSDVPPEQPAPPPRRSRRWLIIALVGAVAIAVVSFLTAPPPGPDDEAMEGGHPRWIVSHLKHKPEPSRLGIEYHFDRNAIVDSRLLGTRILGLAASGNFVVIDAESFKARQEKVLRRRATCLGPADTTHVLAGIANGSIVRVAVKDLAIEEVTEVPGWPRWIGKRGKDGAMVIAYQPESGAQGNVWVRDDGVGRTYEVGPRPVLFLDSKDRLWIASGGKVQFIDLATSTRKEVAWKGGWPGLRGFAELSDGQIWAVGGADQSGEMASYIVRLHPGPKPVLLHAVGGKHPVKAAPTTPITHVLESQDPPGVLVVSQDAVTVSNASLTEWQPLDALVAGRRESDAMAAIGQADVVGHRVLLSLARGGFMEVTADFTRRHLLDGQNAVSRPSAIVRLTSGMAFYGDGGPLFYKGGGWHPLPDPIMPPAELMGLPRPGEKERLWVAMNSIPIEGEVSYVIAKAGPPRNYVGHIHGLRDVFLTARWDGKVLAVLGREELPIEPDDTFATPDKQLWNVDDQGLWNFSGGHWRMVMRAGPAGSGNGGAASGGRGAATTRGHGHFDSPIGEPLHFAETFASPFYGLPSAAPSWALVRLDSNEAGGVPLIDEVPVKLDGRRLLIRDLSAWGNRKEELLLATDHGLCAFNIKWGNCELLRPEGLGAEVSLFMRDGTKRLWLGGRGLWVLRDPKHVDEVHSAIPMLADTRVVALAEAPDGRLIIGLEDRGAVFLTIPPGWFQRPRESLANLPSWERVHAHEPSYLDRGVVLRECRGKAVPDAVTAGLVAGLRELAQAQGARVRVSFEENFEGHPDIVVRGAEPEALADSVLLLVEKLEGKARWSVLKRFGSRGSNAVELKACPP